MKMILMLLMGILVTPVQKASDPLIAQLKRDEGFRRLPYRDNLNRLIIGYGHKLQADGEHPSAENDETKPQATFNRTLKQRPTILSTAAVRASEIVEAEYLGTLNKNEIIGMTLIHDPGDRLHGVYFYKKDLKDIPLEGEYTGQRDIVLREHNGDGSVRSTFQLHFAERDPLHRIKGEPELNQEILKGLWADEKGSKNYPVFLDQQTMWDTDVMTAGGMHPYAGATELEQNAQAFYFAVLKGDKQTAANHVHYPLRINSNRVKMVHNKTQFLRLYRQLFTKEYVACIEQGIPHHIWGNSQGWMIADGSVWFDEAGQVMALNICKPKESM